MSGNTVLPHASAFTKLAKLTIFGIFNELLSTLLASLAMLNETILFDFQTPWCVKELL